ncbi:MAG TPA: M20/M25/M40 family metallo-hydrolase [Bacteroidia bacterium]|jgi:hypothetical protein|nr:M20/M25/M40 family metallo-hydrolase [Bacteroidia bacterium]
MLKKFLFPVLLVFCTKNFAQTISVAEIKKNINFLAGDILKGRGTSSAEETVAAEYIAATFKSYNLTPKGNNGFIYDFTFKTPAHPHDTIGTGEEKKSKDVVAFLNNNAKYTIVIGAHYDHLGLGHDHNSLDANPEGKIHNGADDNASGTAGVLELAKYFSTNNKKENYNFLFICFSGEELGLIGSKKWCEKPTLPLDSINYMINMDMIGRLNDSTNKIIIYGVGTSPIWVPLIDKMQSPLSIKKDSSGIGPSDQTSFYLKNLPVLHFFTGQHSDYHKPSDDANKINYEGEKKVLEYIVKLIEETDAMPKLTFLKTKTPDTKSGSFKVTMGVMPDYVFEGKGMRIDGVTEGKPASKAGIKQGDVVIKLGDDEVDSVQTYMKALSKFKKGDAAKVKVLRDKQELEMNITF